MLIFACQRRRCSYVEVYLTRETSIICLILSLTSVFLSEKAVESCWEQKQMTRKSSYLLTLQFLIFKRHQSDSFEESRSCFLPPPRPDSNVQLLTCFLLSLMCNRDKLTKRQLPIGNQLGVLLRVARIKVCQKLRQHLKNHQRVKYAQHKLVNAKILSIRLTPRTHLHIVIFEHHWVFKFLQGLLIDFNLIVEFLVLVLPAFNSYLMLKRKSTLSIFYFNS